MDIKPVRPPKKRPQLPLIKPIQRQSKDDDSIPLKVPEELLKSGKKIHLFSSKDSNRSRKQWWIWGSIIAFVLIIAVLIIGGLWWYNDALGPKSSASQRIRVVIEQGTSPDQIAKLLQDKGVIKSSFAFQLLTRQDGDRNKLQAGTYLFTPSLSSKDVLNWLVEGKVDTFNVTILPGQTLAQIKDTLVKDGFSASEIDAAYTAKYDHPLLADKPAGVNLEGYVYPNTYQITSETTVQQLLIKTFNEFYAQIQSNDLKAKLTAHGFNLHQGITLASIIQKEVSTDVDRKQVAQVFELRLSKGMPLGSDVTFMYAASLTGQTPSPDIDSPYNTRKNTGLPPGAIANFSLDSLEAVADPAPGDYLYFVAGDDGATHFARTEQEHEANVKQYCTKLCGQ